MPSMKYQTRLEECARYWDWHRPEAKDVIKHQQLTDKMIDNFFDLFALLANELRDLKGVRTQTERPYWQPNSMPTFIERKPPDPDDPD